MAYKTQATPTLHTHPEVNHTLGTFLNSLEASAKTALMDLEHVAATTGMELADNVSGVLGALAHVGIDKLLGGDVPSQSPGAFFDLGGLAKHLGTAAGEIVGDIIK